MQRRAGSDRRGQVIIVAALVIATVFVGLALVLNSGIYAENLSSRETTGTDGALTFTVDAADAVAEAYERTNAGGHAAADDARASFESQVDDWAVARERRGASQGVAVDVDRTAHVGWRLEQTQDGSFLSDDGSDDWALATGAGDVGTFEMDVERSALHDANDDLSSASDGAFNVTVVGEGGTRWRLYVFQDAGNGDVVVYAGDPDEHSSLSDLLDDGDSCSETTDRAVVDFRAEELAGSDCPALNFSDDVSGSVDVYYGNAESDGDERINGTYALVVNGSGAAETGNFAAPGGAEPTATAVVYSASYATRYRGTDLDQTRRGRHAVREETYAG